MKMKYFVQFKTHNLNGEVSDALGSDGVFILDGRNNTEIMKSDAEHRMYMLRNVQPGYIGYEIRYGEFGYSRLIHSSL